jgi:hypothetical protein
MRLSQLYLAKPNFMAYTRVSLVVNLQIGILAMTVSLPFPCHAAGREAIFPARRRREKGRKPLTAMSFPAPAGRFWGGNKIFSRVFPCGREKPAALGGLNA